MKLLFPGQKQEVIEVDLGETQTVELGDVGHLIVKPIIGM